MTRQASDSSSQELGEAAEAKAETLRRELDVLLDELKLRGRRMFDVRYQLKAHPGIVAGAGFVLLAGTALTIAGVVRSRRRAHTLKGRLRKLAARLGPGKVAVKTRKRLRAQQKAAAGRGSLGKQLLMLALPRLLPMVLGKLLDKRPAGALPAASTPSRAAITPVR